MKYDKLLEAVSNRWTPHDDEILDKLADDEGDEYMYDSKHPKNKLIKILKDMEKLGYTFNSYEATPGAYKIWMDGKNWKSIKDYAKTAGLKYYSDPSIGSYEYRGNSFEISKQVDEDTGNEGIFIAVYSHRPEGEEFRMGVDA